MTSEDKIFLRELQNELKNQTTDGNTQPVFWGIVEEYMQLVPDGYGDTQMIIEDSTRYTIADFIEVVEDYIDIFDKLEDENAKEEALRNWKEIDKTDAYAIVDFKNYFLGGDAEVFEFTKENRLSTYTGAFLTKKSCQKYIEKYGYNHNKPRTFAMTAIRNYELERLLHILTNMNLDDIKED